MVIITLLILRCLDTKKFPQFTPYNPQGDVLLTAILGYNSGAVEQPADIV